MPPRAPAAPRIAAIRGRSRDDPKKAELLRRWVQTPQSSWVWGLRYQLLMSAHDIQYKDKHKRQTALCRYPNTHINTYYAMRRAMSKGKFVHRNLYKRPYILLRGKRPKAKWSARIRGRALARLPKRLKTP